MAEIQLNPAIHTGLSRVWNDDYGTQYGQDAGTGQIYRVGPKGRKRTLAHVPPIDVEVEVTPIVETTPQPPPEPEAPIATA